MINTLNLKQIRFIFDQFAYYDRQKLLFAAVLQFILAFFDLIGIFFIGILGSVTIYGVQSKTVGDRTFKVLELLNLENFTFHYQVAALSLIAFSFLFSKTIISAYLTKRILFFLSIKGAELSAKLTKSIFDSNPQEIIKHRKLDILYALGVGIDSISTKIIAIVITLFSDAVLLVVLFIGMLIVNPITTLVSFTTFGLAALILNKIIKGKAYIIGQNEMKLGMKSNQELIEGLNTYNELYVHNKHNLYAERLSKTRLVLGDLSARRSLLPILSKLFFEISLLLGTLLVSTIQFLMYDATYAIAGLAIFFAAASRIAPALLRIQQNLTTIHGALGNSEKSITLLRDFGVISQETKDSSDGISENFGHGFVPRVELDSVSFSYQQNRSFSINNLNLTFDEGTFTAIVGSSGSGKSTLINLILGLTKPVLGEIKISGIPPQKAFQKWSGLCSYVPQDYSIIDGTVEENIALGFEKHEINSKSVNLAIDMANLRDFVDQLPLKEKTYLGDGGNLISGGQKQRLVIARALYTKPKLLILDEATSALDSNSEKIIADILLKLKGEVTLIVIAHRLSSIKNADKVVFLQDGEIKSMGNFSTVRKDIPEFEASAKLFGIIDVD